MVGGRRTDMEYKHPCLQLTPYVYMRFSVVKNILFWCIKMSFTQLCPLLFCKDWLVTPLAIASCGQL